MRWILAFLFLFSVAFGSLEESLREHVRFSEEGPNRVGYLYIGDHSKQINQSTFLYVKNALEEYRENLPAFIILKLDTPGGQVFAAQKISDALKEMDIQYGVPVVAVIDNWAISAGAMLAYSCRYIATVKDGSMGAAQPVMQAQGGTTVASEKVNSAIRADFANRAAYFDRNPLIAEAMVDPDIVLVRRGEAIIELNSDDEIRANDRVITRKDKLLTLGSQEMIELGVADFRLLPEKLVPITEAERKAGEWPASKELLFTVPFFKAIPDATVHAFRMDWKVRLLSFLSTPIVTSILFLLLMVCFYVEFNTPGFGVAGSVGIVALFLILLASFSVQAVGWLEVIILLAGIGLILMEIFVIPGFGVTGILGIVLTLGGLFALILPEIRDVRFDFDSNTFNAAGSYFAERLLWLAGTFLVGVVVIAILARFIVPRLTLFSPLVLRGEQEAKEGYVAGTPKEKLPKVGAEGVVVSPLRTAGKVEIEGELFDAVSSGKFLEKGEKVKVIGIEGSKMIVEEIR